MRAAILAAGQGSRLRPFTDHVPKPLLTVGNVPLIDHALALIRRAGIDRIAVNFWHTHADRLKAHLGPGVVYSEEPTLLGTGGGVKQLDERLGGDEPLLIANADALCGDVDLRSLIETHRREEAIATWLLREGTRGFTPVWQDAAGFVRHIGERDSAPEGWRARVFTGIHILERRLIKELPPGPSCLIESAYRPALARGERVAAGIWTGFWSDVGTPERLWATNLATLNPELRLPAGTSGARRGSEEGRCLVDPTAILEARVEVHGSVVGSGVFVGAGARISHSVLLNGARVEPGERLRGAIRGFGEEWSSTEEAPLQELP